MADARLFVDYMNGESADAVKWFSPEFRRSVGNWRVLEVQMGDNKKWNYRVCYNVPLDW